MKNFRILKLVLCGLFFLYNISGGQDLFDSTRTATYAEYLYRSGNYRLAIDEYERYVFQFKAADSDYLRLISAYRKAGMASAGQRRMLQFWDSPSQVSPQIAREYFGLRIITKDDQGIYESINNNHLLDQAGKVFLSSTWLLLHDNYSQANDLLTAFDLRDNPAINSYQRFAVEGMNIRFKSPFVSGTMSAIIPGSGKFYTGQWQDGLISVIMIGSLAWQSYRGFDKNGVNSAFGWVFGTIGAGFYISNITGSIKAAHRHNNMQKERIRSNVETVFHNHL